MSNRIDFNSSHKKIIIYVLLIMVTLCVYSQVNQFDFINFDDSLYATQKSNTSSGLTGESLRWAFSIKFFGWDPLTFISLMLDHELYGLYAGGYHVTNLVLHLLSTLLLFWLFCRMTGAIWKSAFVAAFFALHPLHVESVAWIAERKDVLSGFFFMLTLCLYVYYTEKPVIKRYLPVLFSFILALMSKPIVVTLPVIMILLDYWPLKRFETQKSNLLLWQVKEKIPLLILSFMISLMTVHIINHADVKILTFSSRLANAPVSFLIYLEKTLWPQNMAVFYPFPAHTPPWQAWGALLLIIMVSVAVLAMAKRLPHLFVGWFWHVIIIFPTIKLIQVGNDAMADRYHYLPSIGLAAMLAWGIPPLIRNDHVRKKILFPVSIAFLVLLLVIARQQCGYWKNSMTLFSHALEVTRDNYLAHNNLGIVLFNDGKIDEALHHYTQSLRIMKDNAIPYTNRGILLTRTGHYLNAVADFNEAIRLKPDYVQAYNGRGNAYFSLGQYDRAVENYHDAIRLQPDYAQAYNNRGVACYRLGQYHNAVADYSTAIRLRTDYFEAFYNRGNAYYELGQYQLAVADYDQAIHLNPDYAHAYNNRGNAHLSLGNKTAGCRDVKEACTKGACNGLEWSKQKGLCR